jgi:transposase
VEIEQRLEDDQVARRIERQVNQLDRSEVDQAYRGTGSAAYDPIPLLKMALYQCQKGNQSPATWYEEAKLNAAMQWLGRGYVPSRRTWYDFRDRLGKFIEQYHVQIVVRAVKLGFVDPTEAAQDGTLLAACASRHRLVNESTLEKRREQLEAIRKGEFEGELPKWVPSTESGQQDVAKRMDMAAEVLAERIANNAKKPSDKRKDPEKIQVSLSDPAAPLGRDKLKVFRPLYNVQYVVTTVSHFILAYCCEPEVTDVGTLPLMIDKIQKILGDLLKILLADAAYCSIIDLQDCLERGVELLAPVQANAFTESKAKTKPNQQLPKNAFVWDEAEQCYRCPQGQTLAYLDRARKNRHHGRQLWEYRYRCDPVHCSACPLANQCLRSRATGRTIKRLEGEELLEAQRAKMADPKNQERYRLRGQTVELAFAESKGNRKLQRFHGRGLARVRAETGLMVVALNLVRLDRLEQETLTAAKIPA